MMKVSPSHAMPRNLGHAGTDIVACSPDGAKRNPGQDTQMTRYRPGGTNTHSGNGAFGSTRFANEIDFERHVDYVHFDPVKQKLVSRAREWPYSSFRVYVRRGLKPADWAGDVEEPMMDFGERRG